MKQNYFIKYLLSGISGLWLLGSAISFLLIIFFLVSGNNGYFLKSTNSVWGSKNIYKNGYPITVNATLQIPPDTLVKWKTNHSSGQISLNKDDYFRYDKVDSILSDSALKKEIYFFSWTTDNMSDNKILKEDIKVSVPKSFSFDSIVSIKSKSLLQNIAFSLSSIIGALIILLISYNVFKLVMYLRNKNSFLNPLYKRTLYVGIILITGETIKFCLGILYSKWFGIIRVADESLAGSNNNNLYLSFNPTTSGSLSTFLFGLCLIVLSSLFKLGYDLEKENTLTV